MRKNYSLQMICTLTILLFKIGLTSIVCAQEAFVSAGNDAAGSGGSASSSIGQVLYTSNTGEGGIVFQGVQLPFEISVVTQIRDDIDVRLECVVFPNPTSDMVNLIITGYRDTELSYQLFDLNGKLLMNKKIENPETPISMLNLPVSTYFIKIIESRQEIKIFKIIKN